MVLGLGARSWSRGRAAGRVVALFHDQAVRIGLVECPGEPGPPSSGRESREESGDTVVEGPATPLPHREGADVRGGLAPTFRSLVTLDGPSPSGNAEQFA